MHCTLSWVNLAHTEVYHELHKAVSILNNMGNAVRMNVFGVFMKM